MTLAHTNGIDLGGIENTYGDVASVAAPGAGATVLSIVGVVGAVYRIRATLALTGTAETALTNIKLRDGGATLINCPSLSGQIITIDIPRHVQANTSINIIAVAAATAGSVYTGALQVTRIQ